MTQTGTPREIDTQLAAIYRTRMNATRAFDLAILEAHGATGSRKLGKGRWSKTSAEAEASIRDLAPHHESKPWDRYDPTGIVEKLDRARAAFVACDAEQAPLDDAFLANPWTRFFLVTSSSNGHIHSSMSCSTCRMTTEFTWLPELSGKTEADAVAAHGPLLCSVCFPSAPVEWTAGKPADNGYCTGSADPTSKPRTMGYSRYQRCTCGYVAVVNANGSLRKHKPGAK